MSKTVIVHKAEKLVREVSSATIEISKEILRTDVAPAWDEGWRERNEAMFTADANLIADALHSSLPGGTFDRLVAELMRRKASHLTVAHSTPGSAAGLKQDDIATCQKCRGENWEHGSDSKGKRNEFSQKTLHRNQRTVLRPRRAVGAVKQ